MNGSGLYLNEQMNERQTRGGEDGGVDLPFKVVLLSQINIVSKDIAIVNPVFTIRTLDSPWVLCK